MYYIFIKLEAWSLTMMTNTNAKPGRLNPSFTSFAGAALMVAGLTSPAFAANQNDSSIIMNHDGYEQLNTAFGKAAGTTPLFSNASHTTTVTTQLDPHAAQAHTSFTPSSNHSDHGASPHFGCGGGNEGHTIKLGKHGIKADALFGITGNEHVGFVDAETRGWWNVKIADKKFCVMTATEYDGNPYPFARGGNLASSMLGEQRVEVKIAPNTYVGGLMSLSAKRGVFGLTGGFSATHILPGDWRVFAAYAPNGNYLRVGIRGLKAGHDLPLIKDIKFLAGLDYDLVVDWNLKQASNPSIRFNIYKEVHLEKFLGAKNKTFVGCGFNNAAESYWRPNIVNCSFKWELG
jgi:hypothetical protein